MSDPIVYTDDPDANWTFTLTSRDGIELSWSSPVVAIGSAGYTVAATWLGDPGTTRQIRVPLVGLTRGRTRLFLRVPGGTDVLLGAVYVSDR